ncbi:MULTISPECIES: type II secretion system F family protein [Micromonospora]|uniref:Flp pilus assembly protein TadB n=1 Tax=Micromonospora yangpuensis TaxID=683228 RepID=A0A1C6U028_9ACTN|nr:type II secretion system F family protein [Micromonospora yangpuensis]GGM21683.1 hypothetical protein GCM10012279_45060 [Micromonospora yangpuensis]SCL47357.1 Flp pilus assembly protein TadB [Micromonospora yangpuensis]
MSQASLLLAGLGTVAVAALVALATRRPLRRLRRLPAAPAGTSRPRRTGPVDSAGPQAGVRPRPGWRPDRIRWAAAFGGLAVAVVVGGWAGAIGALPTAVLADRLLRRIEPPAERRRRLREATDLPLAADLLAAALRAGAPVDRSVLAVAETLDGPLGARLGQVGRTLLLGGEPGEAWAYLTPVSGADRLVAAAIRSSASGAALTGALTRLADDLRADRSVAVEASARRAGVLIVLPLGLCFLPAFILAGLVPVIVAVLGDVL